MPVFVKIVDGCGRSPWNNPKYGNNKISTGPNLLKIQSPIKIQCLRKDYKSNPKLNPKYVD